MKVKKDSVWDYVMKEFGNKVKQHNLYIKIHQNRRNLKVKILQSKGLISSNNYKVEVKPSSDKCLNIDNNENSSKSLDLLSEQKFQLMIRQIF